MCLIAFNGFGYCLRFIYGCEKKVVCLPTLGRGGVLRYLLGAFPLWYCVLFLQMTFRRSPMWSWGNDFIISEGRNWIQHEVARHIWCVGFLDILWCDEAISIYIECIKFAQNSLQILSFNKSSFQKHKGEVFPLSHYAVTIDVHLKDSLHVYGSRKKSLSLTLFHLPENNFNESSKHTTHYSHADENVKNSEPSPSRGFRRICSVANGRQRTGGP